MADDKLKLYRSAVDNGLGTVYSECMTLLLIDEYYDIQAGGKRPCDDARRCLILAIESFEDSVANFSSESFELKRKNNNYTDLLIKVGENYRKFQDFVTLSKAEHSVIFGSREMLVRHLESNAGKLVDSIHKDTTRFTPVIFVTLAQAYATMVTLLTEDRSLSPEQIMGDRQIQRYLNTATTYLQIATLFDRANLNNWNFKPFCFSANHPVLESEFNNRIHGGISGLPKIDEIGLDRPGSPLNRKLCRQTN